MQPTLSLPAIYPPYKDAGAAALDYEPLNRDGHEKGPVFRVTGLPAPQPDDELNITLKATINDNPSEEVKSKLTVNTAIVPSCYDNEQERVALVEFRGGVPEFLSELEENPLGDWQVEMGGMDTSFDCHSSGSHSCIRRSQTRQLPQRERGNLGRMWLRDFVVKDLLCCRTTVYGYNSKLSSHGVDTIMDYGRKLIEELKKVWNTEEVSAVMRCCYESVSMRLTAATTANKTAA
ncbi:MAG: hypothetical protein Q9187_001729 [Circinaria calcarea]